MSEAQVVASLGIGGGIAVILVLWITGKLVPSLINTFREEMALERKAHLEAVCTIALELRALRDDVSKRR
jgi:hypothetical protein